ncbi:hypothetical protein LXL04_012720 [Taraxacum kok-saghyz]
MVGERDPSPTQGGWWGVHIQRVGGFSLYNAHPIPFAPINAYPLTCNQIVSLSHSSFFPKSLSGSEGLIFFSPAEKS